MIADLHGGFNTASMEQPPVDVNFKALLDFLPRMEVRRALLILHAEPF
jgi:hypothetical protein